MDGSEIVYSIPLDAIEKYLKQTRWFGGKGRVFLKSEFELIIPCFKMDEPEQIWLTVINIKYEHGDSERYFLPIASTNKNLLVLKSKIHCAGEICYYDALYSDSFRRYIFDSIKNQLNSLSGVYADSQKQFFDNIEYESSAIFDAEQSNSSFLVNDKFFFKVFRKISKEENTDYEILKYLSVETDFKKIPLYCGSLKISSEKTYDNGIDSFLKKDSYLVVMVLEKIENSGSAWQLFYHSAKNFLGLLLNEIINPITTPEVFETTNKILSQSFGIDFFNKIEKLSTLTSQMHLALLANPKNLIEFKKELLEDNRKLLEEDLEKLISNRIESLNKLKNTLSATEAIYFKRLHDNKDKIITMMHNVIRNAYSVSCIRIHGDYHLGQALWTGNDFVVLDFEGEPDKPHVYRRSKFPCSKDVAGIIRSFHYAIYAALFDMEKETPGIKDVLDPFAKRWYEIVSEFFLKNYYKQIKGTELIGNENETKQLLEFFLFEKAIYELGYEINNRPAWLAIPLKGINDILEHQFNE
jgi:maltose alpha-D-glucosyltransferase / alpha-amylase